MVASQQYNNNVRHVSAFSVNSDILIFHYHHQIKQSCKPEGLLTDLRL